MNDLEYCKRRISELEEECVKKQNEINQLEESCGRMKARVDTYVNYILPRATEEARQMIDNHQYVGIRITTCEEWANKGKDNNSESEKYRKDFDDTKKERDCQISEYQKKIDELTEENNKYLEQIMSSIQLSYGYSVNEVARAIFEHCNINAERLSNKNRFDYREQMEKNAKEESEFYIFGIIKCLQGLCNGENYTEENLLKKFLPTEPIAVADLLITASGECEPLVIGKSEYKDTYRIFDISELRQIAEHLLVYCNHNEETRGD